MTRIESGLAIVAALLDSAVDEWASSSTHDGDDWSYIDAVKAERDFANTILMRLTDDASDTALLIVTLLVRSARDTFESLISGWDDDQLKGVPTITAELAGADKWLEGKPE
jgi:hypothetical protein